MSVIGDALKAAQREKQRRSGTGGPPPIIVPLKGRPSTAAFGWKRAVLLGAGGAAIFGATAVGANLMKRNTRQAPPPAPTILGDVPAAATPTRSESAKLPAIDSGRIVAATPPPPRAANTAAPSAKRISHPTAAAPVATAATQQGARDLSNAGLRIAVEQPREDAARMFAAAVAAHRSGDLSYARTAYERLLTMLPADVEVMNNLGILLSAQRDFDQAERLLRRASTLAPRNAGVWNNLGTVLRERGQSADAIAAFQHSLGIDPLNQSARVSLAQQYFAIGSLSKARELLEQVVTANPAVPEAQYTLGQILEQQGDRTGAIRAYNAFVQVAPGRFATHVEHVRRRIAALSR